jgi:type 1 glutamine amidotransferase
MSARTLALCDDAWHPGEVARRGMEKLGAGGFAFEFLEDGTAWSPGRLAECPVIVLAKANMVSSRDKRPWLTPDSQPALPDHVRRGNSLMVVHAGVSRYDGLPLVHNQIGGAFLWHPPPCLVNIEPKAGHALTAGVSPFTIPDEHYFVLLDAVNADVFLHSRSGHGLQPAGWTRQEGRGRVWVLNPGHNVEVWLHPPFQVLLLNSLRWAAKLN